MEFQTIKLWKETLFALRLLALHSGESMAKMLDRLVMQEIKVRNLSGALEELKRDDTDKRAGTDN